MIDKCKNYKGNEETCFTASYNNLKILKKLIRECKANVDVCQEHGSLFASSFLLVIEIANSEIEMELKQYITDILGVKSPLTVQDNRKKVMVNDELVDNQSLGLFVSNLSNIENEFTNDPAFYKLYTEYDQFIVKLNDNMSDTEKLETISIDELENIVKEYVSVVKKICKYLTEKGNNIDACSDL
jgi:hypothetical protein